MGTRVCFLSLGWLSTPLPRVALHLVLVLILVWLCLLPSGGDLKLRLVGARNLFGQDKLQHVYAKVSSTAACLDQDQLGYSRLPVTITHRVSRRRRAALQQAPSHCHLSCVHACV